MKAFQPKFLSLSTLLFFSLVLFMCSNENKNNPSHDEPSAEFRAYWFQGKGEINTFSLEQARYGEIRTGTATLIFVSEDFSFNTHTKANENEKEKTSVLKMNFEKKFQTGIYPYSLLLTVASPIQTNTFPHPISLSASIQEWCGHTFLQWNLKKNKYEMHSHSYFPDEGNEEKSIPIVFFEDEIWTRIRLGPEKLPLGDFECMPSLFFQRLLHRPNEPEKAKGTLTLDSLENTGIYRLDYPASQRYIQIQFEQNFPFKITGWEESYKDGLGENAKPLTTIAKRIQSIQIDYWNKNHNADSTIRKEIGY